MCGQRVEIHRASPLGQSVLDRPDEVVASAGHGDQRLELPEVGDRGGHHGHAGRAVDEGLQRVHRSGHCIVEVRDESDVEVPEHLLRLLVGPDPEEVRVAMSVETQHRPVAVGGPHEHELPAWPGAEELVEQVDVDSVREVPHVADEGPSQRRQLRGRVANWRSVWELAAVGDHVHVGGELLDRVRHRIAVGDHDVAASQDLALVTVGQVSERRVVGVPGAGVVHHVGNHEIRLELVDHAGDVLVDGVDPDDGQTVAADADLVEDRCDVICVGRSRRQPQERRDRSAVEEGPTDHVDVVEAMQEPTHRLSHHQPALVGEAVAAAVCGDQLLGADRAVEVHDLGEASRPLQVLKEHVLTAPVDRAVVLLPEHHEVKPLVRPRGPTPTPRQTSGRCGCHRGCGRRDDVVDSNRRGASTRSPSAGDSGGGSASRPSKTGATRLHTAP